MIEPCPFCNAHTVLTNRRYEPEGFPYVHLCEPMRPVIKVPNERDFCPSCAVLTWGAECSDCGKTPLKKAVKKVQQAVKAVRGGVPL